MWTITEESATALEGFKTEWLPSAAYKYVTPRIDLRHNRVYLKAENYTGTIALNNGETLQIIPKVGAEAFGRMILVSENLDRSISDQFTEFAKMGFREGSTSWIELLARPFVQRLQILMREGILQEREIVRERLPYTRGRLDAVRTAFNLALRRQSPVECEYGKRTLSTPANRVLAAAALQFSRSSRLSLTERAALARWIKRAGLPTRLYDDLDAVSRSLELGHYSGARAHYFQPVAMARLVLAGADVALGQSQNVDSEVLLVSTELVYEKDVRELIARALAPQGYVTGKGSTPALTLFTDGAVELTPDIVVSARNGTRLIADAKYKGDSTVSASDAYQLYTYARTYELNKILIIFPGREATEPREVFHRTRDGISLIELHFSLSKWISTEDWLASRVEAHL